MPPPSHEPEQGDEAFDLTPSKFNIAPPERQTLRNIARHTLGKQLDEKVDPSDVVQESLAAAWTARADFRGNSRTDFFGWLKRIVKNRALNILRYFYSRRRRVDLELSGAVHEAKHKDENTPSQSVMRKEDAARVAAMLERLPEAERKAVFLRYLEDRSLDEIAHQLGRTRSAIVGLIKRGMKRLRELMHAQDSTGE